MNVLVLVIDDTDVEEACIEATRVYQKVAGCTSLVRQPRGAKDLLICDRCIVVLASRDAKRLERLAALALEQAISAKMGFMFVHGG